MKLTAPPALTLGRVELHLPRAATADQFNRWRWQVSQQLGRLALHPALPPQAIVVVRRLSDPRPGQLLSSRPGDGFRAWERQVQNRLDELWRAAIRPAREAVPPDANVVWFADAAEWLACLSWDLHRGAASTRWWWRTWLRDHFHRPPAEALARLWLAEAVWLPPAIALLHRHHGAELAPLLNRPSPPQAALIRQQIAQAYALPSALPAAAIDDGLRPHLPPSLRAALEPLPAENRALAACCWSICHAPAATARLHRAAQEQRIEPPALLPAQLPDQPAQPATPPAPDEAGASAPPPNPKPPATPADALSPLPPDEAGAATPPPAVLPAPAASDPTLPPALTHFAGDAVQPPPATAEVAHTVSRPTLPVAADAPADPDPAAETGIATGVGGLWYLVNLLADLEWLPDDPALNGWHKLLALARALLPDTPPDSVWGLLLALAAEEMEAAGPEEWLAFALPAAERYLADRLPEPEAITAILQEPATLYLTRTHIDVIFALERVRLDVRLAGLDRDPGWVPALGRVIAFHYE